MPKVVINRCSGGFGLSAKALKALGTEWPFDVERTDPRLVAMVEADPDGTASRYAVLKVVDVPDDADWYITELNGKEFVAERHRTWS